MDTVVRVDVYETEISPYKDRVNNPYLLYSESFSSFGSASSYIAEKYKEFAEEEKKVKDFRKHLELVTFVKE